MWILVIQKLISCVSIFIPCVGKPCLGSLFSVEPHSFVLWFYRPRLWAALCRVFMYTDWQVYTYSKIFSQTFWLFWPPSKKYPDTNDTSFESPNMQLLKSKIKLGVASFWGLPCPLNWKSNVFRKTDLAPFLWKIFPFLFLIYFTTTQGFQKRYITLL